MKYVKNSAHRTLPSLLGILAFFCAVVMFTACGKLGKKNADRVPDVPPASVVDLADVFTPEEEEMLASAVAQFERSSCGRLFVLTVHSTGDVPIETFSREIANDWKIATDEKSGVLLTFAIADHRDRIEVSREWEDVLTNERCAGVLKSIVPELQAGRYADACAKAVRAMELHFPK
jgi:uncharacterized protein